MDSKGTVSDTGFASPSASWFKPAITLAEIPKPALDLFVRRTGLAVDEVVSHINEAVRPYSFLQIPESRSRPNY